MSENYSGYVKIAKSSGKHHRQASALNLGCFGFSTERNPQLGYIILPRGRIKEGDSDEYQTPSEGMTITSTPPINSINH